MTTTANKGLTKPANGADVNVWDVPVNGNSDIIDAAFGGLTSLSVTAVSGTVTLSATQYRPPIVEITGTLTAAINYQLPANIGGFWYIFNNTTGAFAVTWSSATGSGTTVTLQQGATTAVICDGTNVGYAVTTIGYAAGSNTQVQFNNSGALGGSSALTWNGSTFAVTGALAIKGASSGAFTLTVPAAAGSVTYLLPATAGSAGAFLTTDGLGGLTWTGAVGGVTSFSGGTTGLTPSSPASGAVTLAGTLATANGGTALTAFTSGGALYATSTTALTSGVLPITGGGTGIGTTPSNGQLLIGNGTGWSKASLTAGAGVTITLGTGTILISASAGTVTSVNVSGGSTGLTFSGGPITGAGTITAAGTLAVANGGTGVTSTASIIALLGLGTAAFVNTGTSGATVPLLNGTNTWAASQTDSALATFSAGANMTPAAAPATNAVGYLGLPQNAQNSNYGLVMADAGKTIFANSGGAQTITIPANSSVAFPIGTVIKINANGAATVTLAITSDTLVWLPSSATGSRTITGAGFAVIEKIAPTFWWVTGINLT